MFESVLLPAPFSPSSACTSPAAASNSTPSFASTPGKRFVIRRIETAEDGGAPLPAPRLRRKLLRVGVVADPRDALRLGELTRRGRVDVLPEHVGSRGDEALSGLLLLRRIEPVQRPDEPDGGARMRQLCAERERVRV